MSEPIAVGASAAYRAASEALHNEPIADRQAVRFAKLWACGFADLIRADFYSLLDLTPEVRGNLLDAGCGTGIEIANVRGLAPKLSLHGVDISGVALADAAARSDGGGAAFYQAALERLPFADTVFDYITSNEVIEHVEDPAVVLREFLRVLKPGGVCAIATPNGASLWLEHLRQQVKRATGRRGAPVGEDHTRSPSARISPRRVCRGAADFRRCCARISDVDRAARLDADLEPPLGTAAASAGYKFAAVRPGQVSSVQAEPHGGWTGAGDDLLPDLPRNLVGGPRRSALRPRPSFARNRFGIIDFTRLAPKIAPDSGTASATAAGAPDVAPPSSCRVARGRGWRRLALIVRSALYAAFLLMLMPLGFIVGAFYPPFRRQQPLASRTQ